MVARKFSISEVVQLVSGSPKMTITRNINGMAGCKVYEVVWFENSDLHERLVLETALVKSEVQ